MVGIAPSLAAAALAVLCPPATAGTIDLARWSDGLPKHYVVHGVKSEPTYQEVVDIRRDGDVFTLVGGAPAWERRSEQKLAVAANGDLRAILCPAGMDCASSPTGFLATAAIVSASRRGLLKGLVATSDFAGRAVLCVPAENLGVTRPVLDPCFDVASGAVLAQRHRLTGKFDGPTLDADSVRVSLDP